MSEPPDRVFCKFADKGSEGGVFVLGRTENFAEATPFISETALRAVYEELREELLDTPSCDYRDGMRLAMGKIWTLLEGK